MIKAIIFDMNGVIIDDEHIHEKAFQETVKDFGIHLTHKDYLSCCAGKTDRQGYLDIERETKVKLPIDKLLNKKSQMYIRLFPENKIAYKGVIKLIKDLSKQYIVALTSSSSRAEVDLIIDEFDIKNNFKTTISGDDMQNGKPNPEPYIKTVEILQVKPTECVVIEDSYNGIKSAKDAGCYCVAITTTHKREYLNGADIIVNTFDEITNNLINNINKI
jgi:HAD superfamily hydrolase (TIGR01509 family)